ncbi:amidohydrolase family protein [Phenylobacterium sp.]|jgi:cytosine/adenosine deaminase-related metal-dependent hydrolase|uniref:amidohydrolase family protein n=1 Tax=Phenylobacterium sp. TaxID=1871053 RepID=UPI0012022D93|nr:amidohydrolase family protein [Phenylobacterium sp.]THD56703.1 MAG: hydrolase [Phenylobacterium sp.]
MAACVALLAAGPAGAVDGPAITLYRHATLIDGTGGPLRPAMSVLVEGERIKAVAPDAELTAPAGAKIVDLTGKFLAPGLIDSHEHLATPPNRRAAEANMRRDLYGGVTAIRDMADDLRSVAELARESRAAEVPGPDIYYAALMAGPSFFVDPRTHAANFGVEPGHAPWMQAIDAQTDIPNAITLAKGTSATAIKIYANLPPDLVEKIAKEAHRQGMVVWTHSAIFPTTPEEVLAAHPDVTSHTCYMAYQVVGVPASYQARVPVDPKSMIGGDNPVMAHLFARMKAQGTLLDPTLRVYAEDAERFAKNPKGRPPLCPLDLAAALTRQAFRAGVPLSTGTDGIAPATDPWPTVYDEIALLVRKAGLTPAQAIHAATEVGARAAAQGADMGTVAPGKLANLIVLGRDPTADVENLKSLETSIKRGRAYPRADFKPPTEQELRDAP